VDNLNDWKFSSYHFLLNEKPSCLQKAEVLEWFDGKKNYWELHQEKMNLRGLNEILFEE